MLYKLFNYICMALTCERDAFFRNWHEALLECGLGLIFGFIKKFFLYKQCIINMYF